MYDENTSYFCNMDEYCDIINYKKINDKRIKE